MRKIVVLILAGAALAACAAGVDQRAAALRCQEVGITSNSPEFSTCVSAYTSLKREQTLNEAFRKTLNPGPYNRNVRNQEVF